MLRRGLLALVACPAVVLAACGRLDVDEVSPAPAPVDAGLEGSAPLIDHDSAAGGNTALDCSGARLDIPKRSPGRADAGTSHDGTYSVYASGSATTCATAKTEHACASRNITITVTPEPSLPSTVMVRFQGTETSADTNAWLGQITGHILDVNLTKTKGPADCQPSQTVTLTFDLEATAGPAGTLEVVTRTCSDDRSCEERLDAMLFATP